jgi:hypothetical protein
MGPKEASRQPVGLRHEHVQDFSDSFSPKFVNKGSRRGEERRCSCSSRYHDARLG